MPSAATKSNPPGREPWSILNRLYQDLTLCWDITVIAPLEKTMASSFVPSAYGAPVQDELAQLPISTCMEYRKGQIIYGPAQPSASIYLIAAGKVKLSQLAQDGSEILLEIIVPDELFGESAFVNRARRAEQATALENAKLMFWPITAMEDLVTKRPGLAVSRIFHHAEGGMAPSMTDAIGRTGQRSRAPRNRWPSGCPRRARAP